MKGIRIRGSDGFQVLVEASRRGGSDSARHADDPIRQNTRAAVDRNLVTGLASIQLVDQRGQPAADQAAPRESLTR